MYKRMLVPLDGSELSEVVFPYAKELAGRLHLDMVFLHVYSPAERELAPMYRAYVERAAEIVGHQSKEVQQRSDIQAGSKAIEAQGVLAMGHPAEEILRYTNENDIDLILMATHGRSGIRRWAMGSVADKVLRASSVPVWLVRAGISEEIVYDRWPKRTILVPLDGSELAESVLPHVEALAKQRDAGLVDVVLLNVCEPLVMPAASTPEASFNWGKLMEEHIAYSKRVAEQYLAGVGRQLKNAGLKVSSEVLEGEPAGEIINYANKNPFNLIVMATHGRSGLSRWAYGSVAGKVLLGVSSPVFLVRVPSTDGSPWLPPLEASIQSLPPI
jgi:nucleotide-binding universal stress UspA family protein